MTLKLMESELPASSVTTIFTGLSPYVNVDPKEGVWTLSSSESQLSVTARMEA